MDLGALVQTQHLKSKLDHLKTIRLSAKENYRDAAAVGVSNEELQVFEQAVKAIDDECADVKKRLMLLKLKYGV